MKHTSRVDISSFLGPFDVTQQRRASVEIVQVQAVLGETHSGLFHLHMMSQLKKETDCPAGGDGKEPGGLGPAYVSLGITWLSFQVQLFCKVTEGTP